MSKKVSIIMPVRNGVPFLRECLNSIIEQNYDNWQLLVVNDHSIDHTAQILEQYAAEDARIITLTNTDEGITPALRLGYSYSDGYYITRMDADDIMPKNKLESLVSLIEQTDQPTVATGKVQYFAAEGVKAGYKSYEQWLNSLCDDDSHWNEVYRECVIPSPCWMMRRSDFDMIGGFSSSVYPEDYDLTLRMYSHEIKVVSSDKILHQWRDHSDRASRNDPNYADNRFLSLKMRYYIDIEISESSKVCLIGAGTKGKKIARTLTDQGVPFVWLTNNVSKIGHDIYGTVLESYVRCISDLRDCQVIISLGNPIEREEVYADLAKNPPIKVHSFS